MKKVQTQRCRQAETRSAALAPSSPPAGADHAEAASLPTTVRQASFSDIE
jgi:hypothetical protein